jgi:glucan phosphorylase
MDFELGDVFYAIVSDRDARAEQMNIEPHYRIHRGVVLYTTHTSIIEGDERFLRNQVGLKAGLVEYARSLCFHTIEEAQHFIDERAAAEEMVVEIL